MFRPRPVKEMRSDASMTRRRVSGCTLARPLSAFDAVATDTPARRATSRNVAARGRVAAKWVPLNPHLP